MTKVKKVQQRSESGVARPCSLRSIHSKISKDSHHKKRKKASERKEWRDAKCSVCLEYPHNAVLLLCSSHHKGCRSYMCATSFRYSNCLDQYKKTYTKVNPTGTDGSANDPSVNLGSEELLCPLCRGQVKGWTVVKQARKFFNSKKRSCMQENCSFVGSYKDLRKHVRADHPSARPREVDPTLVKKWKKLENDRELDDVMSTINSTMPGAIVVGDYVIERGNYGMGDYMDDHLPRSESRRSVYGRRYEPFDDDSDDSGDGYSDSDDELPERFRIGRPRHQGRAVSGSSIRRLRRLLRSGGRRMGLGSRRRHDA